ncbi:hypothetical protein [Sandaracinus amylolyticus]|uniref:BNR repeat domain protein n=1 Tax=Sandaracinus amylolyticus TaxID=927083 RepID=A0A0F6SGX3_9BACT|nr:hypothetical protein [Sandaracinus amylolyticus]AKF09444.1 hypothetical protein DB32_006593 [Sandaracinus amylolyticus]
MLRHASFACCLLVASGCYGTSDRDPEPEPDPLPPCADWCWVEGADLTAIDGVSPSSVIAVGEQGSVIEWTGAGWREHDLATRDDLLDVAVARDGTAWVVSLDAVWRAEDGRWSAVRADRGARLVAATSATDAWIADGADIEHFDGARWEDRSLEGALVFDMLAVAPGEVWMLAMQGADLRGVMRHDGARWAHVGQDLDPLSHRLAVVDGEVVIVGRGEVLRYDGAAWSPIARTSLDVLAWPGLDGAVPTADDALIAAHAGVVSMRSAIGCGRDVVRIGAEAFCLGLEGQVLRYDGASAPRAVRTLERAPDAQWGALPPAFFAEESRIAWGGAPDDLWRVRAGIPSSATGFAPSVLERYDGETWTELATGAFADLDGASARSVWIVADPLLHWDGERLHEIARPAILGTDGYVSRVHAVTPQLALFVAHVDGRALVLRYDGAWSVALEPEPSDPALQLDLDDVAGTREGDLWAIGVERPNARAPGAGVLFHFDGVAWSRATVSETWGFGDLVAHGDTVWATSFDASAPVVPVSGDDALLARFHAVSAFFSGRLWVGDRDVWLASGIQIARRSR